MNLEFCDICGEPMMLQECAETEHENNEQCTLSQWVCFCNGGNYREIVG